MIYISCQDGIVERRTSTTYVNTIMNAMYATCNGKFTCYRNKIIFPSAVLPYSSTHIVTQNQYRVIPGIERTNVNPANKIHGRCAGMLDKAAQEPNTSIHILIEMS